MSDPPVSSGAVQETDSCPSPAVVALTVGALGTRLTARLYTWDESPSGDVVLTLITVIPELRST